MLPVVWDDCKTKKDKMLFIKHLEKLESTQRGRPLHEVIFESYMEELSK